MPKITRRAFISGAAASMLLLGTGCTLREPASPTATSAGAYPVTLTHVFGQTTVETAPQRVACLGYASHDACIALGVVPVAMHGNLLTGEETPWFTAEIKRRVVPSPERYDYDAGLPLRALADVNPDLILAVNSSITQDEYDQLSEIAPVVARPSDGETDWRTTTEIVAAALGRPQDARAIIAETEERIAEVASAYAAFTALGGIFADARAVAGADLDVYGSETNPARILGEYGLAPSPLLDSAVQDPASRTLVPAAALARSAEDLLLLATPSRELKAMRASTVGSQEGSLLLDRSAEGYALIEASPLSVRWAAEPVIAEIARVAFEVTRTSR